MCLIVTPDHLTGLHVGAKIKHWGSLRPVVKLGDVRQGELEMPWRMVEVADPSGGTCMFSVSLGDNGYSVEDIQLEGA